MAGRGLCLSLGPGKAVGGNPEGFHRGVFAFLSAFDLFENSCEHSMTC